MANDAAANELIELEKKYWEAMKAKDVDTAVAMSDDPCFIAGAQGVSSITTEQYRKMMTDGKWELKNYTMTGLQAHFITPDVGVVVYTVHEELMVGGQPVTFDANDSSTWVRRNGQWKCAVHTESVAGDPFGRDKTPAKKA